MNEEKFRKTFPYSAHDGCANHPCFANGDLTLTIMRCPSRKTEIKEDIESSYQVLRFNNVRDIWIWRDDVLYKDGITWEQMWKSVNTEEMHTLCKTYFPQYINEQDYVDGRIVYDECIRFKCDSVDILESRELRENDE